MVELDKNELVILANALNELREAIEDWEFTTRIGAEAGEAEELRRQISAVLVAIEQARS